MFEKMRNSFMNNQGEGGSANGSDGGTPPPSQPVTPPPPPVQNPPPPPPPAVKPEDTVQHWQGKYNGLQGHVQTLTEERNSYKRQLEELQVKYEADLSDLRNKHKTAEEEAKAHKATAEQLQADKAKTTKRDLIAQEIRDKYPVLADYANNPALMPPGLIEMADDARAQYLTQLAAREQALRQSTIYEGVLGSVPPPVVPGSSPALSADELYSKLMATKPGTPEYSEIYQQYMTTLQSANQRR